MFSEQQKVQANENFLSQLLSSFLFMVAFFISLIDNLSSL